MKRLACLLAAALLGAAAAAPPPNIVYVIADDLGYGDVHCLNPQRGKIPTPNIDRLAAQGMTFTDAHGGSSVCTPTRYGVLTGRYAWRTRLQKGVLDDYVEPLIAPGRLTVPALLRQHGYHTACVGKWHLPDKKSLFGRHGNVPVGTGLKQRFHGVDTARMPTGRQERGRNMPGRPGHALDGPARGRLSGPNADERQTGPAAGAQPFA